MLPKNQHIPGQPETSDIPEALLQLCDEIEHPLIRQKGISCTEDGKWALYVTVPKLTQVPLADLESRCMGFPVVYEAEPDSPITPLNG